MNVERRPSAVPGPVPVASEEALQEPRGLPLDANGQRGSNRWAAQLERLGQDAPVALASSLRRRAAGVEDERSLRSTLEELGYDERVQERASRRARGGIRHARFVRTASLAILAAAIALAQNVDVPPMGGGFSRAAKKALVGRFDRYVRASGERGVDRTSAGRVWDALAEHANQHGWCFPSIRLLAKEAWVSERTVQRCIVILHELGYLLVFPREMERGIQPEWEGAPPEEIAGGRSHMYLLLPGGVDEFEEQAPAESSTAFPTVESSPAPRPLAIAPLSSSSLAAIAPQTEPPEEWKVALADSLRETEQRLGLAVPAWRIYGMAVDAKKGPGATVIALGQARQRWLNERAASEAAHARGEPGRKVDELRFLEIVRLFLPTCPTVPVPEPRREEPSNPIAAIARADKEALKRSKSDRALADQLAPRRPVAAPAAFADFSYPDPRGPPPKRPS